tara:strand:+ start:84 stop:407 length:324 start_codon:yes stop_codon:yes gene_type:complete
MSVQMLKDIEGLRFVELTRAYGLGFGVKKRTYSFLNSPFEFTVLASKGELGVCYNTDQIKFNDSRVTNYKKASWTEVGHGECSLEDILTSSNLNIQNEILMNLNLFI